MPSFSKILNLSRALSHELPDVVFIGGVAVYLHLIQKALRIIPLEASHDADFMVSFADYGVLKDVEEITPTPRLAKHQMIMDGVEFNVYVERLNRLVVPYDEIFAQSTIIERTRVACLEHLLVLKLEALKDHGHSDKGEKDQRDIAKIGLLLGRRTRKTLVHPYMRKDLIKILLDVAKSSIFFDMCSRNAHAAKKAKTSFASFASDLA
jgi:hypothetical protein